MATASDMILRLKNWNVEETTFGPARPTKAGGKSVPILLANGQKPVIQFPRHGTYGLVGQTPPNEPDGPRKFSVNLKLIKGSMLCEKLTQLEALVIKYVTAHGGELLGQADQPEAVIKALSYPIVKYPKDKETGKTFYDRDPTTKLKVSYWDGVWRVELFDSNKETIFEPKMEAPLNADDPNSEMAPVDPTDPELAPSGTEMVGLMQCDGIWIASGRFGVTFRLLQAEIKQPVRITGFCIQPDSDDEEEGEGSAAGAAGSVQAAAGAAGSVQAAAAVGGDEEGEGEDGEGEGEPEPAPKTKTKRTRKSKAAA
jgi:hypothetical protein